MGLFTRRTCIKCGKVTSPSGKSKLSPTKCSNCGHSFN